jgi:hypothetical protein
MAERLVDDQLKRNLREAVCGLVELLFRKFPGGTEENHEVPVIIASVSADIRTEHFPKTSLER